MNEVVIQKVLSESKFAHGKGFFFFFFFLEMYILVGRPSLRCKK